MSFAYGTRRVTTRDFTMRLDKERAAEGRVRDLHQFTQAHARQHAHQRSEQSVENQRRMRRFKQQNEELAMEYQIEQRATMNAQKAMLREQDERMAAALFDMKQQREAEEQNVRRICEESDELKELKEKLRQAKISKARANQLAERELIERQEEAKSAQLDWMMEEDRRRAVEQEYEENQRKIALGLQAKVVLQQQINDREIKKAEAYEQFLRERSQVDEIVRNIEAEDRAKAAESKRIQHEQQMNIKDFLAQRKIWRQEERERAEEELRRIEEYNAKKQAEHDALMSRKRQIKDGQDEILRKLTKDIEAKRRQEEEMRALLDELYQEEAEQRSLERAQADLAKQERMKREMQQANEYQRRLKAQQAAQQAAEDQAFRQHMLEKFARDRELERLNEVQRRREMEAYKKEVERMVEERRAQYKAAVEVELEEQRIVQDQERFRQAVIERERQRLLRAHAQDLAGYLPKGVLKDEGDYETVFKRQPERKRSPRSQLAANSSSTINPVTGRPASRPARMNTSSNSRPPSAPGRQTSPNSRDSLDQFAINNDKGYGSRSGSRQSNRSNYSYNPDKGPADRPF